MNHKLTIVTQLHESNNREVINYFEDIKSIYSQAKRETYYHIRNNIKFNKSKYNTYLQDKYNITKRTANSIISDAQGRLNAIKELKRYEIKQLERKINFLETIIIPKLLNKKKENIIKLNNIKENNRNLRIKQKNLRRQIAAKKNRLNHMKQLLSNLKYQISNNKFKICFGSKYLLKRNIDKFKEQRDSQISYVGCKLESQCNQMLQLTYNKSNNQFEIKLRKDFKGNKQLKTNKYVTGKVYFKYGKTKILDILKHKSSPLSYKIIKKNNRYYLYCTYEITHATSISNSSNGVIGIDFNKGFIAIAETNQYGHLINYLMLYYPYRLGNKTKLGLEKIVNEVARLGKEKNKPIVIEDLNFKVKKSETEKGYGKKYNEMLHSLCYRTFSEIIETRGIKEGIKIIKVNPAWTTWIGETKYNNKMKLNKHIGASYVIARRGQGYQDKVI